MSGYISATMSFLSLPLLIPLTGCWLRICHMWPHVPWQSEQSPALSVRRPGLMLHLCPDKQEIWSSLGVSLVPVTTFPSTNWQSWVLRCLLQTNTSFCNRSSCLKITQHNVVLYQCLSRLPQVLSSALCHHSWTLQSYLQTTLRPLVSLRELQSSNYASQHYDKRFLHGFCSWRGNLHFNFVSCSVCNIYKSMR